jgi:MFS transporter, DHA3 family, macrolide efflux protein
MSPEIKVSAIRKPSRVLGNRSFALLFAGKIISQLGDQVYAFALSWYILDLTKSSLQMAVFLVIDTLVVALVSPFGGIIADRVNRKRILVWMDAVRGVLVLLAAVLLSLHLLEIWMLYVSAVFLGFCGSVFSPAAGAIIPNVVADDQLTEAVSLNNFTGSFCAAAGLLISGMLYSLIGVFAIFVINALSYFISGILEAGVRLSTVATAARGAGSSLLFSMKKTVHELKEGLQYVAKNKLIRSLTGFNALFNLFVFPVVIVLFPYTFNVILKAEPFQLALAQSSGWIAVVTGNLLAPLLLKRVRFRTSILFALSTYSACTLLMVPALLPQLRPFLGNWAITAWFCAGGLVLGLAMPFIFVPINVLFQRHTSDQFRGRFWGIQSSLTTATMPLGYFAAGFLAQRVAMAVLFTAVALIMFSVGLWISNVKEVKTLQE